GEGINDDDNKTDIADSNIYISFEGWGLNAVANESYLSKQIQNWTDLTFTWNVPSFRRSYWGMGVAYGKAIDTTTITNTNKTNGYLTYYSWADLSNTVGGVQYCNEYTNTPANVVKTKKVMDNGVEKDETTVDPSATTSVLLKTRICDADGNQLDMVLHNGVLYTKNGYLSLVINALKAAKTGKYYYENGTEPDGSTKYTKIEAAKLLPMVKLEATGEGDAKIHVIVDPDADFSTLPKLYTIDTDNNVTEMTYVAGDLANDLVEAQNNWVAQEYKGGMMYYNIPVEHLAASEGAKVDAEGYYGVVRNHWYKLTVNSVKRLGHPVLDKDEVIVPKVEDPTYYLGAQINILSWKVVNQNVTLE
ncbi:MAG: Mfa1 fimbrilin C-terminal domain-containing protein, partial [Muribaculaceae bacterium]|nr:Mfa1 fimbrilin C-terminal domain-containing protein [Muribaculaceae bacterium]